MFGVGVLQVSRASRARSKYISPKCPSLRETVFVFCDVYAMSACLTANLTAP